MCVVVLCSILSLLVICNFTCIFIFPLAISLSLSLSFFHVIYSSSFSLTHTFTLSLSPFISFHVHFILFLFFSLSLYLNIVFHYLQFSSLSVYIFFSIAVPFTSYFCVLLCPMPVSYDVALTFFFSPSLSPSHSICLSLSLSFFLSHCHGLRAAERRIGVFHLAHGKKPCFQNLRKSRFLKRFNLLSTCRRRQSNHVSHVSCFPTHMPLLFLGPMWGSEEPVWRPRKWKYLGRSQLLGLGAPWCLTQSGAWHCLGGRDAYCFGL